MKREYPDGRHRYSAEDDDVVLNLPRGVAAELLGVSRESIRVRERLLKRAYAPPRPRKAHVFARQENGPSVILTEQQKADRDYRAGLLHASYTAWHLGDPLPGYSALDRRGS